MQQSKSNANTNTLVYISRVDARFSERDIMDIMYDANIGRVAYVDFTAVKDNSPDAGPDPAFKFFSAFVMMSSWNPVAFDDFIRFEQLKVYVDKQHTSYLLLRPATEGSEIRRSKVNTHQLAHYTAELYKRADAADNKAQEQAVVNEDNNIRLSYCVKDLYDKVNAADAKIEQQAKIIEDQNERMSHMLEQMEKLLAKNHELSSIVSYMDGFMTSKFAEGVVDK